MIKVIVQDQQDGNFSCEVGTRVSGVRVIVCKAVLLSCACVICLACIAIGIIAQCAGIPAEYWWWVFALFSSNTSVVVGLPFEFCTH